jgi:hypothetical protein
MFHDMVNGGPNFGGLGPAFISFLWEEKGTANANLTWVKGNHNFKFGTIRRIGDLLSVNHARVAATELRDAMNS